MSIPSSFHEPREVISLPQTLRARVHFLFAWLLGWIHKLSVAVTRLLGEGIALTRMAGATPERSHFKSGRK